MSLTTTPASLTVAVGNAPKKINIAPPVDSSFSEADLRVIVTGLPTDGTVYLADGVTPVLNGEYLSAVQLAGLTFVGSTVGSSSFTYTAIDPTAQIVTGSTTVSSGTSASGTVTFTVTANTTGPVTTSGTLSVNAGATATSIGIVAPTDPTDPPSSLTVTVLGLPEYGLPVSGTPTSVGTVTLSDGVTPVFVGETLTMSQLTGLMFTPTAGDTAFSTQFSYTVTDSSGNSSLGTATLNINPTSATIWTVGFVGPGGVTKQKSTIQAAITAAANGDTIEVLAGTYTVSSDIRSAHKQPLKTSRSKASAGWSIWSPRVISARACLSRTATIRSTISRLPGRRHFPPSALTAPGLFTKAATSSSTTITSSIIRMACGVIPSSPTPAVSLSTTPCSPTTGLASKVRRPPGPALALHTIFW